MTKGPSDKTKAEAEWVSCLKYEGRMRAAVEGMLSKLEIKIARRQNRRVRQLKQAGEEGQAEEDRIPYESSVRAEAQETPSDQPLTPTRAPPTRRRACMTLRVIEKNYYIKGVKRVAAQLLRPYPHLNPSHPHLSSPFQIDTLSLRTAQGAHATTSTTHPKLTDSSPTIPSSPS